eukprot:Gb_09099 [translate_table: standard]
MLPGCKKLTLEAVPSTRSNPSRSYRIACRPCLATVCTSKLWRRCWSSTKDCQALLGVELRVPNPIKYAIMNIRWLLDCVLECLIESCKPSYCGICMHGITVRTDMVSELGIVLAWPCLDGIDVDHESLGLTARWRGLATCVEAFLIALMEGQTLLGAAKLLVDLVWQLFLHLSCGGAVGGALEIAKPCWEFNLGFQTLLRWLLDCVLECLIESCKPNYCGICMHGITVRTDMVSELGIVLAWPCLDGIDVDHESLGLTTRIGG